MKDCPNMREYIFDYFRYDLDEAWANLNKLSPEYMEKMWEGDKLSVSGMGLNATWDLDELVNKLEMILKEEEKDWCELNDSERREYVSKLFTYGDEI